MQQSNQYKNIPIEVQKKSKHIGEGTYGCVYRPPLPCPNNFDNTSNTTPKVGKLFKSQSGHQDEYDIMKKAVQVINAENKFTTKVYGSCIVNASNVHDALKDCRFVSKAKGKIPDKIYQMVMEDGGTSLYQIRINFLELFKSMSPLFEAIVQLDKYKVAHSDIKPDNVVYNKITKRMLLIDFGLAETYSKIYEDDSSLHDSYYYYYPPEFKLFSLYMNYYKNKYIDLHEEFIHDEELDLNFDVFAMRNLNKLHLLKQVLSTSQNVKHNAQVRVQSHPFYLREFSQEQRLNDVSTMLKRFQTRWLAISNKNKLLRLDQSFRIAISEFASKIDTYSTGITLMETMCIMFQDVPQKEEISKNQSLYMDILNLIFNMTRANAYARYTPQKARKQFLNILIKHNLSSTSQKQTSKKQK